ncbi:MAG TPA: PQQ-binding-like beta-propeller repeat protein [Actinomycetota bacterium]|nr:PQQ-binding-like beta-propeller repeat protein [Actinomycetota bacterium]
MTRGSPRRVAIAVCTTLVAALLALPAGAATGSTAGSGSAKVDWLMYGFDQQRTGYNPAETTIGVGNAGDLHPLWSVQMDSVVETSPVLATDVMVEGSPRDLLYVGDEHGNFLAIDANTGEVIWNRNLGSVNAGCPYPPDRIFGVTAAAAIDRATGLIYEAGGDGKMYAMDLATGAVQPGWPLTITTDPVHEHVWSAVTLFQGRVYVEIASYCDIGQYLGRVVSFSAAQARRGPIFWVTGQGGPRGGGIWGWGGASLDPSNGNLYVATGNAFANPESYAYAEHVVRLGPALRVKDSNYPGINGFDVDFGSTPVLYQAPGCPPALVTQNKAGALMVYDPDAIGPGPVQRIQVGPNDLLFIGVPAYDPVTNMVYVVSASDSSGVYKHGLIAFRVQPNCALSLAWQQSRGPNRNNTASPTAANGVVYYGDGTGDQLFAFDAATGQELWNSGAIIDDEIHGTPIVVNGKLYAVSWDHRVYAFGP